MVITETLTLKNSEAEGIMVIAPGGEGHPNMITIVCKKGYMMCGYLNLEAAEGFGDAAVMLSGSDFTQVLYNPIKGMTMAAAEKGVKEGMLGSEAAEILNK